MARLIRQQKCAANQDANSARIIKTFNGKQAKFTPTIQSSTGNILLETKQEKGWWNIILLFYIY